MKYTYTIMMNKIKPKMNKDIDYFLKVQEQEQEDDNSHAEEEEFEGEDTIMYLPGYDEIVNVIRPLSNGDRHFRLAVDPDGVVMISAADILSYVGRINSQSQFVKKFKQNTTGCYKKITPHHVIKYGKVVYNDENKQILCMDIENARNLILYHIHIARVDTETKNMLYEKFQLDGLELHTPFLPSVENETLSHVCNALPFNFERNKQVDNYRVDCFFPDLKIALECDEYDHKNYDKSKEETRELHISKKLNCTFVRYNPHQENFSILNVIRKGIFKILTPEYQSFINNKIFIHE